MSSLADRLKSKGYELPAASPPVPLHTQLTGAPHRELTTSSREKRQIFTPLEGSGEKAIKAEEKFKKDCEQDLLKGVKKTLIHWVQECLTNPEKRQKLHEKGLLKCRVQAQWSKDLNNALHAYIENFGGRVAASCEKENAMADRPAWEKYAARDEKWMIGFDLAAFQSYIQATPQVLGPSDIKLHEFIEEYSRKVDLEATTVGTLLAALETQFGPLMPSFKGRTKQIVAEVVNRSVEERKRGAKRPRLAGGSRSSMHSPEDAAWAADLLAPLGLKPGSNEPAMTVPVVVLAPILASLKSLEPSAELLRSTSLGIIVASYRQHPSAEIARAAKELVASWKAACMAKKAPAESCK